MQNWEKYGTAIMKKKLGMSKEEEAEERKENTNKIILKCKICEKKKVEKSDRWNKVWNVEKEEVTGKVNTEEE